jgi:Domain of unknown function (DUF3883)/Domain of unknown function (DUF3427)
MRQLIHYQDYSRKEVHDIFALDSPFTPQAGTWGNHGIVAVPNRPRDYVFFVTFGQKEAHHVFDEAVTPEGILRWQSQPNQRFTDSTIKNFIAHDDDRNSIYLFLRTAERRDEKIVPYTYLGRLRYLAHNRELEKPVYFTWQILDWGLPEEAQKRIDLKYERNSHNESTSPADKAIAPELRLVDMPKAGLRRAGLSTAKYRKLPPVDYAVQDARNRQLGRAGEQVVMEWERLKLRAAGKADLADKIVHVAKIEGDGAGYDIRSYTEDGDVKFIEVKTTRAGEQTPFYMSLSEKRFAADNLDSYYIYRVFEFDMDTSSGKFFIGKGDLSSNFSLEAVQFKLVLADQDAQTHSGGQGSAAASPPSSVSTVDY